MAPGFSNNDNQQVRVSLTGRGELAPQSWSDFGVPWCDVADAKSGTRTTIYRDDGTRLVIEPRHGR